MSDTCRRCGGRHNLTRIFKPDSTGAFVPVDALCAACSAPPKHGYRKRPEIRTAIRPGICYLCGYDIVVGQPIAQLRDGYCHEDCRPEKGA